MRLPAGCWWRAKLPRQQGRLVPDAHGWLAVPCSCSTKGALKKHMLPVYPTSAAAALKATGAGQADLATTTFGASGGVALKSLCNHLRMGRLMHGNDAGRMQPKRILASSHLRCWELDARCQNAACSHMGCCCRCGKRGGSGACLGQTWGCLGPSRAAVVKQESRIMQCEGAVTAQAWTPDRSRVAPSSSVHFTTT
jgi:hypothetical protein